MASPPDLTPVTIGTIPTIVVPLNSGGTDGVARRFQIRDELNTVLFSIDAAGANTIESTAGTVNVNAASVSTDTAGLRVENVNQAVTVSEFTDNLDTTGEIELTGEIPAGATVIGSKVLVTGGFAGDTSAVVTIGDGTDVDRYNTGTPDVFSTAATGVETGIPSGAKLHPAALSPVVTVTTATDFGLAVTDDSGALDVTVYFITGG